MSILIHECEDCGHAEKEHRAKDRKVAAFTICTCCRTAEAPPFNPQPTIRETYTLDGKPEALYAPGSWRNRGTPHSERLCDCTACRNVYDQQPPF